MRRFMAYVEQYETEFVERDDGREGRWDRTRIIGFKGPYDEDEMRHRENEMRETYRSDRDPRILYWVEV